MPLTAAPHNTQLRPWGVNLCCDPLLCLSTGVGISGNDIYYGIDLPLPNPFNYLCDFFCITIHCCTKAIYHPSVHPILGNGGMPGCTVSMALGTPIIHVPTGFKARWLTYSMSYDGTQIPVTQMMWW
jgi:hypothetical protein